MSVKKINEILDGESEKEKYLIELFKNAKFFVNSDERKVLIACNQILAYQFSVNFGDIKSIITKAIEEKIGKYSISVGPITEILEERGDVLTDQLVIPTNLNKEYIFDRFQVSSCNENAFKKAVEISQNEEKFLHKNRQFYIFGGYGQGKSHLLQAIAWSLLEQGKNVAYFNSNTFTEYIVDAVTKKPEYRMSRVNNIQRADALMIDDIHSLSGRERVQSELKSLIDYYLNSHKILVFTSLFSQERLPAPFMEEVSSRMRDGITSFIEAPDYELKEKLLKTMIEEEKLVMNETTEGAILSVEVKNVREFIKMLNIVKSIASIDGKEIKLETVKKMFEKNDISIPAVEEEKIMEYIRMSYGNDISFSMLKGKLKGRNIKELRNIRDTVIYQLDAKGAFSHAEIARIFHIHESAVHYILKRRKQRIPQEEANN
jgi:chromosomal replication initiation ATPase DnaA